MLYQKETVEKIDSINTINKKTVFLCSLFCNFKIVKTGCPEKA